MNAPLTLKVTEIIIPLLDYLKEQPDGEEYLEAVKLICEHLIRQKEIDNDEKILQLDLFFN